MLIKRIFLKREALIPHDTTLRYCGRSILNEHVGSKYYAILYLREVSGRTGHTVRYITALPVEIENVSGIYYLVNTSDKVRVHNTVYADSARCKLEPIARLKYDNSIIYKVVIEG